ncbi:putative fungistatic metabolite [Grifola frondosa]|uniref:Putative fungistatic metabolite n=1 Tax=Grifola frondosa TaxID=5627 RepID=A0A1C7MFR8_GRIFR|nr:putative fungistatic metabolite [Grifola frondosa]
MHKCVCINQSILSPAQLDSPVQLCGRYPSRIIKGDVTTVYSDNTVDDCITRCDAAGFNYAGVEYGDECHCGTGYATSSIQAAPDSDCNMSCPGDPEYTCGGSWRIQIYKSPALPPGSWTLEGCAVDNSTSPAFQNPVHANFSSNVDIVEDCMDYCGHWGYGWAGIENGEDCQCSLAGLFLGAQIVSMDQCNVSCPTHYGYNETCGGPQRLMVYEYDA